MRFRSNYINKVTTFNSKVWESRDSLDTKCYLERLSTRKVLYVTFEKIGDCVLYDSDSLHLSYSNTVITKLLGFALFLKHKCSTMSFQNIAVLTFVSSLSCVENNFGSRFLAQLLLHHIQ